LLDPGEQTVPPAGEKEPDQAEKPEETMAADETQA
jgi:hypothetical protein